MSQAHSARVHEGQEFLLPEGLPAGAYLVKPDGSPLLQEDKKRDRIPLPLYLCHTDGQKEEWLSEKDFEWLSGKLSPSEEEFQSLTEHLHRPTVAGIVDSSRAQSQPFVGYTPISQPSTIGGKLDWFISIFNSSPQSEDEVGVSYKVYKSRMEHIEVLPNEYDKYKALLHEAIAGSKLAFIVHGWEGSSSKHSCPWMHEIKDGLLALGIKVVLVDWGKGADLLYYPQAAANTQTAGKVLAKFMQYLVKNKLCTPDDIHLIGFSLGAHVCGWAGKFFQKEFLQKIRRISGLDPAGPKFTKANSDNRLNKSDAQFVDVIHTDGLGKIYALGMIEAIGHVDFYPNGGGHNPGYIFYAMNEPMVKQEFVAKINHQLAPEMYIDSIINPKKYKVEKDEHGRDRLQEMGYYSDGECYAKEGTFKLKVDTKNRPLKVVHEEA